MQLHPLQFEPILKRKVWGGDRLARYGKRLDAAEGGDVGKSGDTGGVGESWEIADLASTSPEGGGGGAAQSRIVRGPALGLGLRDAMTALGPNLMGAARPTAEGGFPLLLKLLDARENLSVQVHPSPAYAATHPGAHLKTESWYVVEAEPGAKLYLGLREGVTAEAFERGIADGTLPELMRTVDAVPGELHHLPSGTVHALSAGVLVAEPQTPSDTTFRVFDWGRTDRTLHVEQALACLDFNALTSAFTQAAPTGESAARGVRVLVETPAYRLAELRAIAGDRLPIDLGARTPIALLQVAGEAVVEDPAGEWEDATLPMGACVLLPAGLADRGGAQLHARTRSVTLEVRLGVGSGN